MANQPEETSLIQKYLAPLAGPSGLGLKDDAACLIPNPGMDLVITTDTIVENVHFLSADTPYQIAIKAITVNLSDLVAKGARPVAYQVALSLPTKPEGSWMSEFAKGLAEQASGMLSGGDITVSKGGPLTITVTAIGEVGHGKMVRRNGAKPGDDIYVAGEIGTSALGLKCALDQSWATQSGLTLLEIAALIEVYSAPRVASSSDVAKLIGENASASLDISDGLVIDLQRLCTASGVGAQIDITKIPLNPIVEKQISNNTFSMIDTITGGDDYIALFTASPEKAASIQNKVAPRCYSIGKIVSETNGAVFLGSDGLPLSLGGRSGYDHFAH